MSSASRAVSRLGKKCGNLLTHVRNTSLRPGSAACEGPVSHLPCQLEPLEPRLLLDATVTLTTPGCLPAEWASGSAYFLESDAYSSGILLGANGLLNDQPSKPTYRFALPDPQIAPGVRELESITVRVYGNGWYWDTADLIIGGQNMGSLPVNEGETVYQFFGSTARSKLTPSADGATWFLDVTVDATDGPDWYDLRDITVAYEYSGISSADLARLDQVIQGKRAIDEFYELHMEYWQAGVVLSSVAKGMQATLANVGVSAITGSIPGDWGQAIGVLADHAWGYVSPRISEIFSYDALGALDVFSWWYQVAPSAFGSGYTPDSALDVASGKLRDLANLYENYLADGQIYGTEIASINSAIDDAAEEVEDIWGAYGVGPLLYEMNRVWGNLSSSQQDEAGEAALAYVDALSSLVHYDFQLGSGGSGSRVPSLSYLSEYVQTLRAQTFDTYDPPAAPSISTRTSSAGSDIPESTWQRDDDPYFHWSSPQSSLPILGYSVATNATPDSSIDTNNRWWQVPVNSLSNGVNRFYVKAYSEAGWGPTGSFTIWVDDAGDAVPGLGASQSGHNLSSGDWATNVPVSFAWSAPTGVYSPIVGYSYAIDGTPDSSVDVAVTSWQSSALGIGEHSFKVRAIDAAGNIGPVESFTVNVGARQYVVSSLSDGGTLSDGQFTLREAILAANTDTAAGDAWSHGSFIGFSAFDRIVLASSLAGGTITLNGQELGISGNLEIVGNDSDPETIDAAGLSRVLNISSGTVSLEGLTLIGGSTTRAGGGIYNSGTLTLTNVTVSGNSSTGDPYARDGGGGIYNGWDCTLTLANVTLSGNSALLGGGINNRGMLTLTNTTVSGNSATGDQLDCGGGGGIYNGYDCTLTLANTIVALNVATAGFQDIYGSFTIHSSLLGVDPGFVRDPSPGPDGMWGTADDDSGDLQLTDTSLAINWGDNALAVDAEGYPLTTDRDGNPRIADGQVDIGAYEYQGEPSPLREAPATMVTTLTDLVDTTDGEISLREAMAYAAYLGQQEVRFASGLSGGTVILSGRALEVFQPLEIDASSIGGLTIDAAVQTRVIEITTGVQATLKGLTLTGGRAKAGGAIFNAGGTMNLFDTTVSGNSAWEDCGGGICNDGTLMLTNVTVAENTAGESGGGIYNAYRCALTLTNSTVTGNTASRDGGGIASSGTTLNLTNTTVAGNTASSSGGGICAWGGTLNLTNTIVSGNTAGGSGGGIYNNGTQQLTNTTK